MSTDSTTPRAASGWYPPLNNLGLPRALTNGIQQGFSLTYSLRDTVTQLQTQVQSIQNKMVQYGTNKQRTQDPNSAGLVPDGALFFETDTGDVYQSRQPPQTGSAQINQPTQ